MSPASPRRSLSVPSLLALTLIVEMLALCLYAWMTIQVVTQGPLVALDRELAVKVHDHALNNTIPRFLMLRLTDVGSTVFILALGLVAVTFLCWRGRWRLAVIWVAVVGGGGLLNTLLKSVFRRARPIFGEGRGIVFEHTYSFTSGHTMGSTVCYGFLAYLLWRALPAGVGRVAVVAGLALLVLGIGFSRIYLGAHWLTDVIGGFALGLAWLTPWLAALEIVRLRSAADAASR